MFYISRWLLLVSVILQISNFETILYLGHFFDTPCRVNNNRSICCFRLVLHFVVLAHILSSQDVVFRSMFFLICFKLTVFYKAVNYSFKDVCSNFKACITNYVSQGGTGNFTCLLEEQIHFALKLSVGCPK